jgi:hypothetical protein
MGKIESLDTFLRVHQSMSCDRHRTTGNVISAVAKINVF